MKTYLGSNEMTVVQDNLKYQVKSFETYDGCSNATINLELIAGWDYINPDMSDVQGWCPPERFTEDVQDEYCVWSFLNESMKECLIDEGYEIIKEGK